MRKGNKRLTFEGNHKIYMLQNSNMHARNIEINIEQNKEQKAANKVTA